MLREYESYSLPNVASGSLIELTALSLGDDIDWSGCCHDEVLESELRDQFVRVELA